MGLAMSSASSPKQMPIPLTPPNSGNTASSGLPAPLTPLFGRSQEITWIRSLLDGDGTRMVTLTGPGGIGKTRLALEVASQVQGDFAEGACFVPLAAIRDPGLVASTIAQALGVRESDDRSVSEVLATVLHAQHLLLVLDNLEQVVEAAPWLADLLMSCPRLKALVTSRIPLRVGGEQRFLVPPLPVPDDDPGQPIETVSQCDSVALFAQRPRAARSVFTLTETNAVAVAEICRRLDGLPLAIELAAARANVLSPEGILARLANRLALLTGGMTDVPDRLRTMRNAIAWSYDLLAMDEQAVFRRLSVFSGGFTLEAAEAVVFVSGAAGERTDLLGGDPCISGSNATVLDRMAALVDQSLIWQMPSDHGETLFGMLETIREYGRNQLAANGESDSVARQHAVYFLKLGERAAPQLTGPDQAAWINRLEAAYDDLRAAFFWLLQHGEPDHSLRLAVALWRFGYTCGRLSEARDRLDEALARSPTPALARAEALNGAGLLASVQGDPDIAKARHHEALDITSARGDRQGIAVALNGLGSVAEAEGNRRLAVERYESALRLFRDVGDRRGVAGALTNLGNVRWDAGDLIGARALHEEARDLYHEIGERRGLAWSATNLGSLAAEIDGDVAGAEKQFHEAMAIYRELGDQKGVAVTLEGFAEIARVRGQHDREGMLFAAAASIRDAIGVPIPPEYSARHEEDLAVLRERLGASLERAWLAGRSMTLDDAITTALATSSSLVGSELIAGVIRPASSHGMSKRELEVLRLMADGLTNQEIADTLFLSHRTVTSHASMILGKLGLTSRTAAVAYAIRQGLA